MHYLFASYLLENRKMFSLRRQNKLCLCRGVSDIYYCTTSIVNKHFYTGKNPPLIMLSVSMETIKPFITPTLLRSNTKHTLAHGHNTYEYI